MLSRFVPPSVSLTQSIAIAVSTGARWKTRRAYSTLLLFLDPTEAQLLMTLAQSAAAGRARPRHNRAVEREPLVISLFSQLLFAHSLAKLTARRVFLKHDIVFVQGLHTVVINDFAFADNLDPNYIKDETIKKYPSYEGGAFTPA